jgi:C1A family cysteine protease
MPNNILEIPQLKNVHAALSALGYQTVEQFVGAVHAAAPAMQRYLGQSIQPLLDAIPGSQALVRNAAALLANLPQFGLGVALDHIPAPQFAFGVTAPTLAPTPLVDLIPNMPPIRNQGSRGTCVAFASLATFEHYHMLQGDYQDIAEQFLYWECKTHDNLPNQDGTWVGVAMDRLQADGCCLEATWPYNPQLDPTNISQGPPPQGAQLEALKFRISVSHLLPPSSVGSIKSELQRQRCVAFSIPVFDSWYRNPAVIQSGDIVMPIPNEIIVGGHAMCIAGYEDLPASPELGGGRFYIRNSWGASWGTTSPHGAGYGTIPYAYIDHYGKEAYSIE